jgi:hypothetical protein
MGQGFEYEEGSMTTDPHSGWDNRFQEQHVPPLKVKNTFISDDFTTDDVGDAFQRRQVSAPAASANYLQHSFMNGCAPDGALAGVPNLRMSDFILDDFGANWQGSEWNVADNGMQDRRLKKKNDAPPPPPANFGGLLTSGFGVPMPMPDMGANMVVPDSEQLPALMGVGLPAGAPPPRPPAAWENTTTVMMRNLPNKYTQRMLLSEINQTGFLGTFDFMYLPIDPETNANRGYAFLNFINASYAWMFKLTYEGRKMNRFNSNKVASVMRATLQGFDANYAHYSTARVNRGDPAARPLFLRESSQPVWNKKADGGKPRASRKKGMGNSGEDAMQPEMPRQTFAPQVDMAPKVDQKQAVAADKSKLVAKFCPHCGGPIQPHFQFCPHCGQTISVGGL